MPPGDPPDRQTAPRGVHRRDRLLRPVKAGRGFPYRRSRPCLGSRAEAGFVNVSGRSEKERRGRRHNRFPDERYPYLLPFLLGRRPYAPFPESAGRMRLFLFLLHDPLCPRTQSQRDDRQHGEAGRRGRLKRGKRDRADRRQHRRLREEHRGNVYRPDPRPRRGGRDRTLPYLLHRTEPDHGRGDRFRGMQQTFRSSFSYSVTERKRRGAETDAPPLRHDPVPA